DWVRKYELNYTTGNNGNRSLINTITETGRDEESNTIALPVNDFDYQSLISDWTYDSNYDTSIHNPFSPQGLFSVPIGDFNSDGLPDILDCEETNSCIVKLNDGDGTGWTASSTYSVPSGVTIYSMATDVNGDGFADFLNIDNYYHETDVIKVYINNGDGTGWTYDSDYDLLITNPKYPSYLSSVPIGDFNGDGLPDIHHCPFGVCETYINNGDGTGWTEDEDYSDLGLSYPSIADVNADGLDDIFIKDSGTIKFYINDGDGTGWTYDSNYNLAVSSYGTGMPVGDFNGDGLPDILDQHDGTSCSTYLNDGDGTGWSISYSYSNAKCWALQVDVNGDGLTDEFLIDNVVKIYLNKGKKSDLLLKFTSSKGAITDVIYKGTVEYLDGSNDLLNPDLPSSMQTVYQEVINDGLGNIATSTYAYYGGDFYYNDEYDRRMAGFNKIVKTDDFGYITNTYYHQGNETASAMGEYLDDQSKINKIYRTEVYDDSSNLYAKTINKWENYNLDDDRDFVKMTESIVFSYDGDTDHKEKASTFSYDNYTGNLIAAINYGEVNGSDNGTFTDTSTDLASTTISYAASSTPYIFGLKSAETTYDYYNSKVKETKYYYDDLSNGNVDVGNLTKQEMWESDSDYINIENTYNSYGLITQTKDPRDKATNYVYDSYNLYIASSTNPLSQQTQFYYDYSNGQATETITPNNRTFETVFDALDRVKEEKQPDIDSPSSLVTRSAFTYYDSSNPKSIVRIDYLNSATSTQTYTYLDGFGRIIQERKEAEDSNIFAVKDFIYNKLGLLEKESLPYFSTGTSNTSPTATSSLYTIFYYDPLGRIVTSVNAVATTTYAYDDWQTTVTDGEGNTKDLYKDAYDNLIKVDEHNGASAYTTEYDYDLLGNLTKIEDALNNERYFAYNGLGRLLTAQDLHALGDSSYATTTYAYDDSGNIT
ncbi:VCBS repeat-containing protein, partial [Patescibacteria group bacterium]|nr:VCBS repeat-containing protein [Patescibacteria group bacterium]